MLFIVSCSDNHTIPNSCTYAIKLILKAEQHTNTKPYATSRRIQLSMVGIDWNSTDEYKAINEANINYSSYLRRKKNNSQPTNLIIDNTEYICQDAINTIKNMVNK